jgi:pyrimidine operon attenuation protein / uracil phosphoribosyltransferase
MTKQQEDIILDSQKMTRALTRIAHEIVEHNSGADSLVFIGIITRGAVLAKRIAKIIKEMERVTVPVGLMDISLYRDDVHSKLDQPVVQRTDILFSLVDRNVILIDDVLFTGRTIRAALDQINDFGRPRTIQLAVLVDRGHRELPIKADYVGVNIPTAKSDQIVVKVEEKDKLDSVSMVKGTKAPAEPSATKSFRVRKEAVRKKGGKK